MQRTFGVRNHILYVLNRTFTAKCCSCESELAVDVDEEAHDVHIACFATVRIRKILKVELYS